MATSGVSNPFAPTQSICDLLECGQVFVPILLGVLFSCVLLGSVLQLSLRYFTLFPEPQFLWRRLLVLFVTLLQALQTSFDVARALQIFAFNYGDMFYFVRPRIADAVAPFIGALLSLQTQAFLLVAAYRYATVLRLRKDFKWFCTVGVGLCVLGAAVAGCGTALEVKLLGSLALLTPGSKGAPLFNAFALAWLSLSAFVDLTLCTVIAHQLLTAKRHTNGSIRSKDKTLRIFARVMAIVIEAGIVLTLIQIATAIAWAVEATHSGRRLGVTWIYCLLIPLSKVYTITFLAMVLAPRTSNQFIGDQPPLPPSERDLFCLNSETIVETVSYQWGSEEAKSQSTTSREAGVVSVTGLPLELQPFHPYPHPTTIITPDHHPASLNPPSPRKLTTSRAPILSTILERNSISSSSSQEFSSPICLRRTSATPPPRPLPLARLDSTRRNSSVSSPTVRSTDTSSSDSPRSLLEFLHDDQYLSMERGSFREEYSSSYIDTSPSPRTSI